MKHPLISGLDWLTRIFFVLPIMLVATVFLWQLAFGDGVGPKYRTTGDCSIAGVAEGRLFESSKVVSGTRLVSKGCHIEYLPGHWKHRLYHGDKDCIAESGERGIVFERRNPGTPGTDLPKIEVCGLINYSQLDKAEQR